MFEESPGLLWCRGVVDISALSCEIRGRDRTTNEFRNYPLRILACHSKPFKGPHLVQYHDKHDPIWVSSLTELKRHFYDFTDALSFERSVYVLSCGERWLLKHIRPYLSMPSLDIPEGTKIYATRNSGIRTTAPLSSHAFKKLKGAAQQDTVRYRSLKLLKSSLRRVFLSYCCDLHSWKLSDVLQRMAVDVQQAMVEQFQEIQRAEHWQRFDRPALFPSLTTAFLSNENSTPMPNHFGTEGSSVAGTHDFPTDHGGDVFDQFTESDWEDWFCLLDQNDSVRD